MEQRAQNYVGSEGKSLPNRTSHSSGTVTERQDTSDVPRHVSLVPVPEHSY